MEAFLTITSQRRNPSAALRFLRLSAVVAFTAALGIGPASNASAQAAPGRELRGVIAPGELGVALRSVSLATGVATRRSDKGLFRVVADIDDSVGTHLRPGLLAGEYSLRVRDGDGSFDVALPLLDCRARGKNQVACSTRRDHTVQRRIPCDATGLVRLRPQSRGQPAGERPHRWRVRSGQPTGGAGDREPDPRRHRAERGDRRMQAPAAHQAGLPRDRFTPEHPNRRGHQHSELYAHRYAHRRRYAHPPNARRHRYAHRRPQRHTGAGRRRVVGLGALLGALRRRHAEPHLRQSAARVRRPRLRRPGYTSLQHRPVRGRYRGTRRNHLCRSDGHPHCVADRPCVADRHARLRSGLPLRRQRLRRHRRVRGLPGRIWRVPRVPVRQVRRLHQHSRLVLLRLFTATRHQRCLPTP